MRGYRGAELTNRAPLWSSPFGKQKRRTFVRILAVATLMLTIGSAHSQNLPSLAAPNASTTTVDFSAPTTGVVTVAEFSKQVPISVTYADVADTGGSGIKQITLIVKEGESGVWSATNLTATEPSGSFSFSPTTQGKFSLGLRVEDNAGNVSPDPTGSGVGGATYDSQPPVITLKGGNPMTALEGSPFEDPGATAQDNVAGDISSSITSAGTVNTDLGGNYELKYNVSDPSGNAATEVIRKVRVDTSFELIITPPSEGTISASPEPSDTGRYQPNAEVTLTYQPVANSQSEVVSWDGAVANALDKNTARIIMKSDNIVSVELGSASGSVSVAVTPDSATWTVTDADGTTQDGAGDKTLSSVPAGSVSITFNSLDGFTTPDVQTNTLAKGETISFDAIYEELGGYALTAPESLQATPGQVVNCPITLSNIASVESYSLTVSFDGNVVECTQVNPGSVPGGWPTPTSAISAGSVTLSASGPAGTGNGGQIAILKLKVKDDVTGDTSSPIELASATLNGGALTVTTENGELTVASGQFAWGDIDGSGQLESADATFIMQYMAAMLEDYPDRGSQFTADRVGDVTADDPSLLGGLDASFILQKLNSETTKFPVDLNGDGQGPDPAPEGQVIAGAYAQKMADAESSTDVRIVSMTGSVQLESAATVEIPVRLSNGARVMCYFVDIFYDSDSLEFVGLNKGDLAESWAEPVVNGFTPGQVTIVGVGAESLPGGAGELFKMTLRARQSVVAGSSAALSFAGAQLNDNFIPVELSTGEEEPVLKSIAPATGATFGGTIVKLTGSNLLTVDAVLFGDAPAEIIEGERTATSLLVVSPQGSGKVSVSASSIGGTGSLTDAYTYVTPDVRLTLDVVPSVDAGQSIEVPITLTNTAGPVAKSMSFKLRYDSTMFTAVTNPSDGAIVLEGLAATQAGAEVTAVLSKPGEVTITVNSSTAIGNGEICSANLLAIGNIDNTVGIIYLSDFSAEGTASSSVKTAAGLSVK